METSLLFKRVMCDGHGFSICSGMLSYFHTNVFIASFHGSCEGFEQRNGSLTKTMLDDISKIIVFADWCRMYFGILVLWLIEKMWKGLDSSLCIVMSGIATYVMVLFNHLHLKIHLLRLS